MKILSPFNHPCVIPNRDYYFFVLWNTKEDILNVYQLYIMDVNGASKMIQDTTMILF